MSEPLFTRSQMRDAPTRLLRDGRAANACVSCVTYAGKEWTVKDFSSRNFFVRTFLAPFLLKHELKILRELDGLDGVANECFAIDSTAIAIRYLPGRPLSRMAPQEISTEYLEQMETLLMSIHARGVVHLDTRGTGNWLVSPDGKPLLIDFQAGLQTGWMPRSWRRVVELIDLSGVYKKWLEWHPELMNEERRARWEEAQRWRQKWKLHGYFGIKKKPGDNKFGDR
mgnify:CR=1 FL=1